MTSREPLRIAVHGAAELVAEIAPEELNDSGRTVLGELIVPLPQTADDRALGRQRYEAVVGGWRFEVTVESAVRAALRQRAARAGEAAGPRTAETIRAAIPGRVTRVWVAAGEHVYQGQRLLAVEAMKMENEIRAPHAGRVERVAVVVGQTVERNYELVTLAEGAGA